MAQKLSNLSIVLGYWNENMNQNFRFNNPKQCSNWIILVSFCSSHLAIKELLQCSFYKNLINWCKNRFFRKKFKKFAYYNEELVHKFKFQTQFWVKFTQNWPKFDQNWGYRKGKRSRMDPGWTGIQWPNRNSSEFLIDIRVKLFFLIQFWS